MADQEKLGKPWSDDELDVIVADYFSMLGAELAGKPYVKVHHSAALMEQIGRTHRSVEFKHQNISAVLDELGMPWIPGYKPKRNYQSAIFGAIDRYLSKHLDIVEKPAPKPVPPGPAAAIFVAPPNPMPMAPVPTPLKKLLRKFDPVERDFRNRALGRAGEEFVLEVEHRRLTDAARPDLAGKVRWVSAEDGDGAGYDIRSFEESGSEKFIEVKTTNGVARTPFFLSRNECEVAASMPSWRIYRVHLFSQTPRIFTIAPPLEKTLLMRTEIWRASPL